MPQQARQSAIAATLPVWSLQAVRIQLRLCHHEHGHRRHHRQRQRHGRLDRQSGANQPNAAAGNQAVTAFTNLILDGTLNTATPANGTGIIIVEQTGTASARISAGSALEIGKPNTANSQGGIYNLGSSTGGLTVGSSGAGSSILSFTANSLIKDSVGNGALTVYAQSGGLNLLGNNLITEVGSGILTVSVLGGLTLTSTDEIGKTGGNSTYATGDQLMAATISNAGTLIGLPVKVTGTDPGNGVDALINTGTITGNLLAGVNGGNGDVYASAGSINNLGTINGAAQANRALLNSLTIIGNATAGTSISNSGNITGLVTASGANPTGGYAITNTATGVITGSVNATAGSIDNQGQIILNAATGNQAVTAFTNLILDGTLNTATPANGTGVILVEQTGTASASISAGSALEIGKPDTANSQGGIYNQGSSSGGLTIGGTVCSVRQVLVRS